MSNEKDPSQQSNWAEFTPSPSHVDEDVSAFISDLITQNAELGKELRQIESHNTRRKNAISDADKA